MALPVMEQRAIALDDIKKEYGRRLTATMLSALERICDFQGDFPERESDRAEVFGVSERTWFLWKHNFSWRISLQRILEAIARDKIIWAVMSKIQSEITSGNVSSALSLYNQTFPTNNSNDNKPVVQNITINAGESDCLVQIAHKAIDMDSNNGLPGSNGLSENCLDKNEQSGTIEPNEKSCENRPNKA